jgi:hypothetical protein
MAKAKILVAGNSRYVTSEDISEKLKALQWDDKIEALVTTTANPVLINALQELSEKHSYKLQIVELQWQDEKGNQNRGALFQAYNNMITKVNGIIAFTTGEDKATAQLERDATKVSRAMAVFEIAPAMVDNIDDFKTPMLSDEQRNKLDEAFDS